MLYSVWFWWLRQGGEWKARIFPFYRDEMWMITWYRNDKGHIFAHRYDYVKAVGQ